MWRVSRSVERMNTTRPLLASALLGAALAFIPLLAQARVIPTTSAPKADLSVLTWGDYRGKQVYVPGKWTVETASGALLFSKPGQTVRAVSVPNDQCAYTVLRIREQKVWNTSALTQSQSKLRVLVLGRSQYKGYTWNEPSQGTVQNRSWCLGQDIKNSVELSVSSPDATVLQFVEQNLLLQLATRHATH